MADTTIKDAFHAALGSAKENFKTTNVLLGYIGLTLAVIGSIFQLVESSNWVTAWYFTVVPLVNVIAALTDIHLLHFVPLWFMVLLSSAQGAAYIDIFGPKLPGQSSAVLLGIGIELCIIGGTISLFSIRQLWLNISKVKDTVKSPFGILALIAWLVVLAGLITVQTQGRLYLVYTTPAFFVSAYFLVARLIPVQGLNAAVAPLVAQQFAIFTVGAGTYVNFAPDNAGAAVASAGFIIMLLLLFVGEYLLSHKPEELWPEIRAKIADIANAIPLLVAFICVVACLAGYIVVQVELINTKTNSSSTNFFFFIGLLIALFNLAGSLLHVWSFHYAAFGLFLVFFESNNGICQFLSGGSAKNTIYWGELILAIFSLLSMFCHNFIDTLKQAPEKAKRVSANQLILLVGTFFLLLGAIMVFFVSQMINSYFAETLVSLNIALFIIIIIFFDTSNLVFLTVALGGQLSYNSLLHADAARDGLPIAGLVFIYIGCIIALFGFSLQAKAGNSVTPDGGATERSSLV